MNLFGLDVTLFLIVEIWTELTTGLERQYETGKRLLSYVKPTERILQVLTSLCESFVF